MASIVGTGSVITSSSEKTPVLKAEAPGVIWEAIFTESRVPWERWRALCLNTVGAGQGVKSLEGK